LPATMGYGKFIVVWRGAASGGGTRRAQLHPSPQVSGHMVESAFGDRVS
jgi:hypothetical protein